MTTTTKPVRRETLSSIRDRGKLRPILIEACATYVKLRLKGCRYGYTVTYEQLWRKGAENAAAERRREQADAKKARQKLATMRLGA